MVTNEKTQKLDDDTTKEQSNFVKEWNKLTSLEEFNNNLKAKVEKKSSNCVYCNIPIANTKYDLCTNCLSNHRLEEENHELTLENTSLKAEIRRLRARPIEPQEATPYDESLIRATRYFESITQESKKQPYFVDEHYMDEKIKLLIDELIRLKTLSQKY
jgi:hypothetical protein